MSAIQHPNVLTGPLVWTDADFENQEYVVELSNNYAEELDKALASFKFLGLDIDSIDRDNFPLPTLGQLLYACSVAVHQGRGFCVLRGLDFSRYSVEDSVTLFLGLTSYIGNQRGMQDSKGRMLSHITESKAWTVPRDSRHGIHSNKALPFHTDMGSDVHALQVRHGAQEGGRTCLSSAWSVFNDLMNREPEVAKTLLAPNWPVQTSEYEAGYYLAPLFTFHEGKLLASVDPARVGPHSEMKDSSIPSLTSAQQHALVVLSQSASRSEVRLKLETDDILVFNNWALLHRREAYQDDERTARHLVRLWLRDQNLGWAIPPSMLPPWLEAYGNSAGTQEKHYPLLPRAEYIKPKYVTGSAAWVPRPDDE